MREILFRGKRKDNGEWCEGFYSAEEYNLNTHSIEYIPRIQLLGKCVSLGVIPETVGQYTGLLDKNGRKIFEGDAVWFSDEKERGVVCFDEIGACFSVRFDTFDANFDHLYSNELEIIGNVYDNPELMEGGE